MLWLMPADLVPGKDRHVPMDTHGKTSALETIRRPLAGQRGSGKCANPLGCRYGRCSGNAVAGAVGVAESAETPFPWETGAAPNTSLLSSRAQRGTFPAASKAPRCARGDSRDSPSDRHGHIACGNCGNPLPGRRESAAPGRRPRCLTGVGVAPILPHRKNGLKSRKDKAF